ncbi:MAG TPA: ABC transporter substrate-binding protein [Patescibacteria group bacterium]|nr:ABC transporter substrate-binding protein [Patescibacteria group bacterium]
MLLIIVGIVVQIRALSPYYEKLQPVPGGTFTEGILGAFTNANPLYATGSVDSSVARLIFPSLMRYDSHGRLINGLAEKVSVDPRGTVYTVTLRPNLVWQDGEPLNAEDVVFTYKTIQNPDAKSPLLSSWQGIKVAIVNNRTVSFTLPNALSSFPYSLTNGIVPLHILGGIPVPELRSASFNTTKPIGAGPFKWETIEVQNLGSDSREERIGLVPNNLYYGGVPKLQRFIIRAFHDEKNLLASLKARELNGMVGLEALPDVYADIPDVHTYNIPINGEVAVFLKASNPALADTKVRQALVMAVNVRDTRKVLGFPVIGANGPLLRSHVGYDRTFVELSFNADEANKLLDAAGWVKGADGIRAKGGTKLTFQLYSENTSDYSSIAQSLKEQWKMIGVEVQVNLQQDADLQATIASHGYDALLFGILLGPDPDVFPFWHSSQADPRSVGRLNLSEYKSKVADMSLEAGRTRFDATLRAVKYRPFLEAWRADAPAVVLYQPRLLYVGYGGIFGFEPHLINNPTDRYANVENWMILQEKTYK